MNRRERRKFKALQRRAKRAFLKAKHAASTYVELLNMLPETQPKSTAVKL